MVPPIGDKKDQKLLLLKLKTFHSSIQFCRKVPISLRLETSQTKSQIDKKQEVLARMCRKRNALAQLVGI